MRTQFNGLTISVGIALLLAGGAFSTRVCAQAASAQDAPPPAEALPPPSMDDPGVAPTPPSPARHSKQAVRDALTPPPLPPDSAPASSAQINPVPMEPAVGELTSTDPTPPKPSLTRSASGPATPTTADSKLSGDGMTVSIRTMDNGDRIEEYRSGGQLTRVKVTPRKAPPYEIIDTNGNGRVDSHDKNSQKTVGWTLFKWH